MLNLVLIITTIENCLLKNHFISLFSCRTEKKKIFLIPIMGRKTRNVLGACHIRGDMSVETRLPRAIDPPDVLRFLLTL